MIVGFAPIADDARDVDDRAGERDGLGIFGALVQHRQLDVGTRAAGQDLDGLVGAHALG